MYCGKMADWIRMLFGVVSEVGRRMGVLDGVPGGDRRRGRGSFGVEFLVSHCNQWGLCCIVVQKYVKGGDALFQNYFGENSLITARVTKFFAALDLSLHF